METLTPLRDATSKITKQYASSRVLQLAAKATTSTVEAVASTAQLAATTTTSTVGAVTSTALSTAQLAATTTTSTVGVVTSTARSTAQLAATTTTSTVEAVTLTALSTAEILTSVVVKRDSSGFTPHVDTSSCDFDSRVHSSLSLQSVSGSVRNEVFDLFGESQMIREEKEKEIKLHEMLSKQKRDSKIDQEEEHDAYKLTEFLTQVQKDSSPTEADTQAEDTQVAVDTQAAVCGDHADPTDKSRQRGRQRISERVVSRTSSASLHSKGVSSRSSCIGPRTRVSCHTTTSSSDATVGLKRCGTRSSSAPRTGTPETGEAMQSCRVSRSLSRTREMSTNKRRTTMAASSRNGSRVRLARCKSMGDDSEMMKDSLLDFSSQIDGPKVRLSSAHSREVASSQWHSSRRSRSPQGKKEERPTPLTADASPSKIVSSSKRISKSLQSRGEDNPEAEPVKRVSSSKRTSKSHQSKREENLEPEPAKRVSNGKRMSTLTKDVGCTSKRISNSKRRSKSPSSKRVPNSADNPSLDARMEDSLLGASSRYDDGPKTRCSDATSKRRSKVPKVKGRPSRSLSRERRSCSSRKKKPLARSKSAGGVLTGDDDSLMDFSSACGTTKVRLSCAATSNGQGKGRKQRVMSFATPGRQLQQDAHAISTTAA